MNNTRSDLLASAFAREDFAPVQMDRYLIMIISPNSHQIEHTFFIFAPRFHLIESK